SFSDHTLDILLGETALVVGNGDLVLLTSRLLNGGNVEDTVGIDIEGHLDLGHTTRHRWDAIQVELTQQVVVAGHGAFTLKDLDKHTGLVVSKGGEGLLALAGHSGVTGDEDGHDTTSSLETHRKRGHIEQEEI